MTQPALSSAVINHPALIDSVRLFSASGELVVNAASLTGNRQRRLIPVLDHKKRWLASLRLEQTAQGLRIRTELLGRDHRLQPGHWLRADDEANIELSWEVDEEGRCRYLAMNIY